MEPVAGVWWVGIWDIESRLGNMAGWVVLFEFSRSKAESDGRGSGPLTKMEY